MKDFINKNSKTILTSSVVIAVVSVIGFLVARNTLALGNREIYTRDELSELINTQKDDIEITTDTFNNSGSLVKLYVNNNYVSELDNTKTYVMDHAECDNGESVKWHSFDNSMEINPINANTKCNIYLNLGTPTYNYGDGSLNLTPSAYTHRVYVNGYYLKVYGTEAAPKYKRSIIAGNHASSPFSIIANGNGRIDTSNLIDITTTKNNNNRNKAIVYSGTNTYNFTSHVFPGETLAMYVYAGSTGGAADFSDLLFRINNNFYSLEQMVSNSYIEPLVILHSVGGMDSQNKEFSSLDIFSLYNNSAVAESLYGNFQISFMSKIEITGFQLTSSRSLGNSTSLPTDNNGWLAQKLPTSDLRYTLNEW